MYGSINYEIVEVEVIPIPISVNIVTTNKYWLIYSMWTAWIALCCILVLFISDDLYWLEVGKYFSQFSSISLLILLLYEWYTHVYE